MRDFSPIAALEENLTWEFINGRQLKGGDAAEPVKEVSEAL
jgi:hypothetical protein